MTEREEVGTSTSDAATSGEFFGIILMLLLFFSAVLALLCVYGGQWPVLTTRLCVSALDFFGPPLKAELPRRNHTVVGDAG